MSLNVPAKIAKETFEVNILKKLNNNKLSSYKKMFTDNYKCPRD